MANLRYPSVYIDHLGRQLCLWSRYGISDSRSLKLMRLWTGYQLTCYMDSLGRYTFHSFNQLRQQLGYKTIQLMLNDVRCSQSFVLISADIDPASLKETKIFAQRRPNQEYANHITAFFSPLWHKWSEADGTPLDGSIHDCRIWSRKCDHNDNNALDNNNPTGSTADAEDIAQAMSLEQIEELEREEVVQNIQSAKLYFRTLIHNPDARQREPIEYLIWRFTQPEHPSPGKAKGFGLTPQQAYEVLTILIDKELAPHFARDQKFMAPQKVMNPAGRIYQVMAYVKRYSNRMQERAFKQWKSHAEECNQRALCRLAEQERDNHPLSPHEWTDTNGIRWYESASGKKHRIEEEAPPRPSATSVWNFISNSWTYPPNKF